MDAFLLSLMFEADMATDTFLDVVEADKALAEVGLTEEEESN